MDTQLLLLHYEMGGRGRGGREKLGNMKQIQRTTKIIGLTKNKSLAMFNKTFQVLETLFKFLILEIIHKTGNINCQHGSRLHRCEPCLFEQY